MGVISKTRGLEKALIWEAEEEDYASSFAMCWEGDLEEVTEPF